MSDVGVSPRNAPCRIEKSFFADMGRGVGREFQPTGDCFIDGQVGGHFERIQAVAHVVQRNDQDGDFCNQGGGGTCGERFYPRHPPMIGRNFPLIMEQSGKEQA